MYNDRAAWPWVGPPVGGGGQYPEPSSRVSLRLNLSTWLLAAGFAILAALLVATFVISGSQAKDHALVAHTLEVEGRLATILSRMQDAETGARGFVITADDRFLTPYNTAMGNMSVDVDGLARATADNPRQQAAMAALRPLIRRRLELLMQGVELRRHQGFAAAAEHIATRHGADAMDAVRGKLAQMRAEEERLLALRTAKAARTDDLLRLSLILGFATLIMVTVFAVRDAQRRLALVTEANARLVAEAENREKAEGQVRQMQKMQSVGQLTGGIAHDFNNMLSVVIGSLDLARRRLRTEPERAETYMDSAMEGAQRAVALTARLLAFSRQQPLAPTANDPNRLVGGMSELLRRTIGEQMRVETVLAGGVWRIYIDAPQLENAILNLCVNARDAMPDGGNLTIETANAFLDEAYAVEHEEVRAGQYVLISVTDTGEGMSAEVISRAFDPFYTTKGVGKGTGLGLSQVYGFVKQSGGHVKIYSEIGRGTSVKLYLPRWMGEGEGAEAPKAGPMAALPTARDGEVVLVVEDEAQVRHMSTDALRDLGYTVMAANSAEQALEVLKLHPKIDLMFTDIVMPGMTGRALAEQVARERPGLKVLYTTGYTRNAVVHNGMLDAGVAFLPKPFTLDQLARKVREVLDGGGVNRPV